MGKVRKVGKVTAIQEQHIKVKTVHKTIKTYSRKLTKIPEVLDVMDVCRICLQKIHFLDEESLISIYSKASHQEQDLAEMIQIISPVKIKLDEKLTDKICTSCNEKVTNSYNLRQQIIESDTALRKASARITIVPIDSLKNASIELVAKSSPPVALKKVKISPALAKAIQKARKQNKRVPPEKVIIPTVYQHLETSPLNIEHIKLEATSWIQPDHQPPPTDQDDDKNEIISKQNTIINAYLTQDPAISNKVKSFEMSNIYNEVLLVEPFKVLNKSSAKSKQISVQQNEQVIIIGQAAQKRARSKNFLCNICGSTCRSQLELEQHFTEKHSETRQQCDVCSKDFKYLTSMKRHKKAAHQNRKYQCDVCKVDYTTFYSLKVHILDIHLVVDEDLKVQCRICNRKFNHAIVLKSHMVHGHLAKKTESRGPNKKGRDFRRCLICAQSFNSWRVFVEHKRSHMGSYKCSKENCGKLFSTYSKLYHHYYYNHVNFVCEICNYKTDIHKNMTRHKMMHDGIKRFGCEFCDRKFGQKTAALNHRNTHTGEKPFKCKSCDNCYSDTGSLSKHKKKMHGLSEKFEVSM